MSPLVVCLIICGAVTAATWLASVATREYSWVDRSWSIAPVAYVWVYAAVGGFDARAVLMAVLVTAWGIRLTFNYARMGGYRRGGEDYRWAVLRGRMSPEASGAPLGVWDDVLAALFVGFLVGETVADQQQWAFHRWKAAEVAAGRAAEPGFLQSGLFRVSRHPNFFFEQAQWWVFYGFAVAATGVWLHWTIAGAVLLSLLFVGSTVFTESISSSKYPAYDDYRARTSPIVPWFPRSRAREGVRAAP